jgi:FrmR/RcnR family transcriptional regulator, repressor of frmRAB operon
MAHTIQGSKRLLSRVRRIKGQTEALEKVLGQGGECLAVLQQIAAIRGAVNGLMAQVLEDHLREHIGSESMPAGKREAEMEQVITVLRSYLK